MDNGKMLRESEITTLQVEKNGLNIQILSLETDIRQKLNPVSVSNPADIEIEEIKVLLNQLQKCINRTKVIDKDIKYKESL